MSALFAPRVLRYAAPALALCMVAVVSYVALRARRSAERDGAQVAMSGRREPDVRQAAGGAAPENGGAANTNAGMNMNTGAGVDASGYAQPATSVTTNTSAQPQVGRGHGAAEGSSAPAEAVADIAPPPPAPVVKEEPAAAPAAAAPKAAPAGEQERAKAEDKEKAPAEPLEVTVYDQPSQQKRSNQARLSDTQVPDDSRSRSSGNSQSNAAGGGAPRAETRDGASARAVVTRRGRSSASASETQEDEVVRVGETRAAAGHRFRREGGAWVDVNYKPSMPSTGVRRGTESFRALVADLPEVGRVAEQIDGEVVVVVRGRAYRIR